MCGLAFVDGGPVGTSEVFRICSSFESNLRGCSWFQNEEEGALPAYRQLTEHHTAREYHMLRQ